jgi:hypothetical protein
MIIFEPEDVAIYMHNLVLVSFSGDLHFKFWQIQFTMYVLIKVEY